MSNQHPSGLHLDPRSESRLSLQTLGFRPYTAPELVDILEQRVEQAFRQDAVSDDVLELIAENVAAQGGDCREALDLLLRAGRRADETGEEKVSKETVEDIFESAKS
ncbi:MAG: hypothetical protein ABEH65_05995 [Halobacteriales archaeon]